MRDATTEYLATLFAPEDATLLALREDADRSGLPASAVAPETGRTLQLLLRSIGARRVLEVGTLAGCSSIWMARALPEDGRVVSIESDPGHAALARRHLAAAGLLERVEVREGRAIEQLPSFDGESFDLMFLDADREPLSTYLDWALRLVQPGGIVAAANMLRGGRVLDPRDLDPGTIALRAFHRRLAAEPRLDATILPIDDGLAVARVR